MEALGSFCWHSSETWCLLFNKLLVVCDWKTIFNSWSKGCYYKVWCNWRGTDYQELDTLLSNINNLSNNGLDSKSFNEILENHGLNAAHERFQQYLNKLRSNSGTMSAFWMSYVDLTGLMLDFIRTSREKDWTLHLISISNLIPWCFGCNRSNYAKYLLHMINLPMTHQDVHEYLSPHKLGTTIHLVVFKWIRPLKKPLTKVLRLLVALKDSVQKKCCVKVLYYSPLHSILH